MCTRSSAIPWPDHLHDMRARRAREYDRWVHRRLCHEPDHLDRRVLLFDRVLLCVGLSFVHCDDVRAAAGDLRAMNMSRLAAALAVALLALLPFGASEYALHIAIQILIWGFTYTAWSMMGRFGLTSFGPRAFLCVC